ncbi:MAG: hypothetical protein J6C89_00055 [Clostridia bacterium]|nr:hypothetical protein [Clostridia bacterium]
MKRIMSLILAVIMIMCMMVPVYAEETEPSVTVIPSATSVNIGDTVTFTVSLSDFPKEKGFALTPSFDTEVFEFVLVSAEPDNPDAPINQMGSFLVSGTLSDCAPPDAVIAFNYATTINKEVFTFTLKAKKAATETEVFCTVNTQSLTVDYTGHCHVSVICPHNFAGAEMYNDTHHKYVCSLCGEPKFEEHEWDDGEVITPATHTEKGEKKYTCEICGKEKFEVIPTTADHEYPAEWAQYSATQHIKMCGCGLHLFEDHKWNAGEVVAPATHTSVGSMKYTCTECHYEKFEEIPETTAHEYPNIWSEYSATQHVKECACGEKIYEAHKWDGGVVTTPASHMQEGVKTYTCSDCKATKTESIPKTTTHGYPEKWSKYSATQHVKECACGEKIYEAHKWDNGVVTTEPTCKDKGVKTYTCSECGETKTEAIPTTNDHKFGDWVTTGNTEHKHVCSVCNKTETAAHKWDNGVVTTQPTCKDEGVKTYTCSDCKTTKTEKLPVTTTHTWGKGTKVDDNTHTHTCTVCAKSETVAHTWDAGKVTKAATCKTTGTKTYTCTDCGATKTETIPTNSNHYYSSWKADGDKHTRTCIDCGAKETASHKWNSGEVTKQPTHIEEGVKTFGCSVCDATKTESIAKTSEHEWTECVPSNDGKTHVFKCACGAEETKDHSFDAGTVTKQPTHTETGAKKFVCADCKYSYEEVLEKTAEHVFGEWKYEPATGKHYRECACSHSETGDCAWDAGVVTTAPTYEATGVKTYTCSVCAGTKTETLAMLEKTDEIVSDGNEGIKITAPEGSSAILNSNTVLEAEKLDLDVTKEVKANIKNAVGGNADVLASYDISLILDGAKVQPGGKVEVTLPALENADDYDSVQVVYIDDEGNVTPCDTTVNEDGSITFVTDHFSRYAIVGITNTSPVVWILISAVAVALIAGVVIAIVAKKKKKA